MPPPGRDAVAEVALLQPRVSEDTILEARVGKDARRDDHAAEIRSVEGGVRSLDRIQRRSREVAFIECAPIHFAEFERGSREIGFGKTLIREANAMDMQPRKVRADPARLVMPP